jgi:hypothetical protein
MKKILVPVSIICFVFSASAQENGGSINKFRFGFKVAPSLAWMKPDVKNFSSNGSKLGFIYGLMMDYNIAKNYAVATGLEVSYRGGKIKYDYQYNSSNNNPNSFSGNDEYNLKYIELPLSIKMKTNEIGYMTYFGQFGFQPAFRISAKEDFSQTKTSGSTVHPPVEDTDAGVNVSSFNVSIMFVAGAEYRISGNTAILAAFQFSNGFTDVLTGDNHQDTDTELKAISNYLSLNIGVFF